MDMDSQSRSLYHSDVPIEVWKSHESQRTFAPKGPPVKIWDNGAVRWISVDVEKAMSRAIVCFAHVFMCFAHESRQVCQCEADGQKLKDLMCQNATPTHLL